MHDALEALCHYRKKHPSASLCEDARHLQPGDCFVAFASAEAYIPQALAAGASLLLCDRLSQDWGIPSLYIPEGGRHLPEIADRFYGIETLPILDGVTGTNGKSTVTYMLASLRRALGEVSGVIGTLGYGEIGSLRRSKHTTPSVTDLRRIFSECLEIPSFSMEVSSHALSQGRTRGLAFRHAIFTQLSRDHLDYHGTMEAYGHAKKKLFLEHPLEHAVLNQEEPIGQALFNEQHSKVPCTVYGWASSPRLGSSGLWLREVKAHAKGLDVSLESSWGEGNLRLPCWGLFNVFNALAAMACLLSEGYSWPEVVQSLQHIEWPPGRMQAFHALGAPVAMVDFAHTPDALRQVLIAVRPHVTGKLWCVFGCGGSRDRGKRPEMGSVAEEYADVVVLCDDNPRLEASEAILKDILWGMSRNPIVIPSRREAIEHAMANAQAEDLVLIAGKGHEEGQIYGTEVLPFSDAEVVQDILKRLKHEEEK